jgi:alanine dehydrogenase
MKIGIPKEIKNNEYRVSLTPAGVRMLTKDGNTVFVQKDAGVGSAYDNNQYIDAGARIINSIEKIYEKSELIIKVKEPIEKEYKLINKNHIIFTYFHLSSNKILTENLLKSNSICIAYETIQRNGLFPLLAPMSEVAGKFASIVGAYYLGKNYGGEGLLISGVAGVLPGNVLILGAGIVAKSAAKVAAGLGARVTIMSPFIEELSEIEIGSYFSPNVSTLIMNENNILEEIKKADILISAVYVRGARTPMLVTREMVSSMKKGSVIIAVDIDQGSSIETARPTTHAEPIYIEEGVVHYCVANMPGIFANTSTIALTNLTLPYVRKLAKSGIDAIKEDKEILSGLNIYKGKIICKEVADNLGLMAYYSEII